MIDNSNKWILQIANFLAVVLTIIVNSLANILPINNKLTGEISDSLPNLFVPAGLTFSIWGIIYILLIFFAVYQIRDLFKKEKIDMPFLKKISVLFIIASLANIIWIFLWHYEQIVLSLIAMIILFFSLLFIYLRLNIGKSDVLLKEKLFVHVPFSVYIGWITVATIANVTAVLVKVGWDGFAFNEQIWTIIVLIVALVITILILRSRTDYAYSAVIIWALIGIYIKRISDDPLYGPEPLVANTALIAIIIIIIVAVVSAVFKYPKSKVQTKK